MAQAMSRNRSEDEVFDSASEALASGEPERGLKLLQPFISSGTGNSGLWHLHGLLLRKMDRRDEAVTSLRRACQLAPQSAKIAHALARTLFEAGLPSLEAYGRAVRLAPADTEIVAGMTSACAAEGEAAAAIDGLDRILSRSPHWVEGHVLLAKLRWAQGEREGFARSFEEALAKMPANMDLRRQWVIVLLHSEMWDEVARAIAHGRAAVGDDALFDIQDALLAAELGDHERAEALLARFVATQDAPFHIRRVRHYLRWGKPEEAGKIVSEWIARPEAFMFWPYASIVWRMTGDPRWQWLEGDERFVGVYDITDRLPPLEQLAATLRNLHRLTGQPLEQSLRGGTQTEGDIFMQVDPVLVKLREAIRATVAEHVAKLPARDETHPLLGPARSPIAFSGAWSVRLTSGGFHANHVHPAGWISSALYVALPPDLGKEEAGFLTLGDPRAPTFDVDVPAFRTIEPKPGRLALFPSYMWHGTKPFGEGERLTVAFDVAVPNGR
jgi:cytochrome c-type biogenesis protein CcmH/NrfG